MTHMLKDRKMRRKPEYLGSFLVIPLAWVVMGLGPSPAGALDPYTGIPAGQGQKAVAAKKKSAKPAAKRAASDKKASSTVTTQGPKLPPIVGRRDPFKLPGPPAPAGAAGEVPLGNLPPGTRGLVISRLKLEGIVRLDTSGVLIAVVDTSANRAYFLRENDAVYNGVVAKITPDSVTFRENTLDSAGRLSTRDVVLRLSQGPGA